MNYYSNWHNLQVHIKQELIKEMKNECVRAGLFETGGVLFGYYKDTIAIVTSITKPDETQKLELFNFDRPAISKELMDQQHENGFRYIGDWHSHPNHDPTPSKIDDAQLIEFAQDDKLNCPEPILFIVGGNAKEGFKMSAQVYKTNGHEIERLPFEEWEPLRG